MNLVSSATAVEFNGRKQYTRVVALVVYNGRIEFRQRIEYRQTTNCKVPQIGNKSRVETTLRLSI